MLVNHRSPSGVPMMPVGLTTRPSGSAYVWMCPTSPGFDNARDVTRPSSAVTDPVILARVGRELCVAKGGRLGPSAGAERHGRGGCRAGGRARARAVPTVGGYARRPGGA